MRSGSASILARPRPSALQAMRVCAERDAAVAQHGRVGEIALPARQRQLVGEVPQQRVGDAEVAFGIFEVDRIHLVRHGGGADFAGDGALAQIAERDVAPQVAAQVDEHDVRAPPAHRSTRRSSRAARSAWSRGCIPAPARSTKARATAGQSTAGTAATWALKLPTAPFHLPRMLTARPAPLAPLQARGEIGELLAEGGGACRLPVGARQHRRASA